jgi:arylsulfatase A-like enzyme/tetratricopeptide (TPR) repeat protein
MKFRILIFVFVGCVAIAAAYLLLRSSMQKSVQPEKFPNANILLITIDTLRADHLPTYGYTKIKTPGFDRLAAESIVFEDAVAHVPMTLPSHACILTGLLPFSNGMRDNAGFILDSKIKTLAEILKEHGYQTAAFVSAFVLDSQFKLDQGFDLYSDDFALAAARVTNIDLYRRAADTEVEVDAWLNKNASKKFFLWVHYYDPHDPYEPLEPYRTEYADSPYDGEIAYTDHVLGKLLDRFEIPKLKQNTIVILTGDHGEGLGEHNEKTHSLFIYNATQHVPFMFRIPRMAPKRIHTIAEHIDIAPTLLDLAGIPPQPSMQGRSLTSDFQEEATGPRAAYSESFLSELHYGWSPLRSLTTSEYKFIEAPTPELYDRRSDRAETKNIAAQKPEIVKSFRKKLEELLRSVSQTAPVARKIDSETEEKLRALGYVGTVVPSTKESLKVDPKDKIHLLNVISNANEAMQRGDYSYVIRTITPVVQQEPQMVDAHYLAANAYLHLDQNELAVKELLNTIKLKPDHTQSLYNLAFFYHTHGNLTAAEYWYKELLKIEPEHLFGNLNLASLYLQNGDREKAQVYISKIKKSYEQSIQSTASPRMRSKLLEKLSEIRIKSGELQEGMKNLQDATKEDAGNFEAWWKLGSLYWQQKRAPEAIDCFRNAIRANDQFYPAYYALSDAYLVTNTNLLEALRLAQTAMEKSPSKGGEQLLAAIRERMKSNRQ